MRRVRPYGQFVHSAIRGSDLKSSFRLKFLQKCSHFSEYSSLLFKQFLVYLFPNQEQRDGEFGIGGIEGGEFAYVASSNSAVVLVAGIDFFLSKPSQMQSKP